jgi:hypothetical protein
LKFGGRHDYGLHGCAREDAWEAGFPTPSDEGRYEVGKEYLTKNEKALKEAKKEIKQTFKAARALRRAVRKRKRRDRERYHSLMAERRTLKRSLRAEYKSLLVEFRTLCATMREAEQALRGALGGREQQSAAFQRGYKIGIEYAQVQVRQAELDQTKSTSRSRDHDYS